MKKWIALLCLALCLLLPLSALTERVDLEHDVSLTLSMTEDGKGLPGVAFNVYRVASMDDEARFVLLNGYRIGDTNLNKVKGAAAWSALAQKLAPQVGSPTASATTNKQGKAVFSDLMSGLYLVKAKSVEIGHWVYDAGVFMVSVPGKTDGKWQYDTVADVKYQRSPKTMELKVIKQWKDTGYTSERPGKITVNLYRDGALDDTVELSARNNWTHTFTGLETIHTWTVKEHTVPTGYKVAYSQKNGAQIITNTYQPKTSSGQSIPQTGLLWWPVPLMAVLGMALVIIGLILRRKWSGGQ